MDSKAAFKKKHFKPQKITKIPNIPSSYIPLVCNDKELYELLQKIEVNPQREVASLHEWNEPMDLQHMYQSNYNLRQHLLCDGLALAGLKTKKQVSCLLLNPGTRFFQPYETAIRWAIHLKLPVITVPRLKSIMKDRIGVEAQMVGIRKNPQISLFRSILKKVRDMTQGFMVPFPQGPGVKKKAVKSTGGAAAPGKSVKKTTAAGDPKKNPVVKASKENVEPDSESAVAVVTGTILYTTFRPVVTDADGDKIKKLLLGLPYLHVGKSSQWFNLVGQTFPEIRAQLILDRTPICALIRRKRAGCVLISDRSFGKLNMKKLIHICLLEDVPVLIVPGLYQTMHSATAIRVNSLAIYMYPTDPLLDKILNTVKFIARRYTCPKHLREKAEGVIDWGKPPVKKVIADAETKPSVDQNTDANKTEEIKAGDGGEKNESVESCADGDEVVEGMDVTPDEENLVAEADVEQDVAAEAEMDVQGEVQSEEVAQPVEGSDGVAEEEVPPPVEGSNAAAENEVAPPVESSNDVAENEAGDSKDVKEEPEKDSKV